MSHAHHPQQPWELRKERLTGRRPWRHSWKMLQEQERVESAGCLLATVNRMCHRCGASKQEYPGTAGVSPTVSTGTAQPVGQRKDSGGSLGWRCHLQPMWPWTSDPALLCLSLLISLQSRVRVIPTAQGLYHSFYQFYNCALNKGKTALARLTVGRPLQKAWRQNHSYST